MRLFRKSGDLNRATVRQVAAGDLGAASRLIRDGARRYYSLSGSDLPLLLAAGSGVALVNPIGDLLGLALVGRPAGRSAWLRCMVLAEGVGLGEGLAALLPALHDSLRAVGYTAAYYAGDDTCDSWMIPALAGHGYIADTEVVVYEKTVLSIPSRGNPAVQVRPAEPVDLTEVLRIDRACFEGHWTKDGTVLGPAIHEGPCFRIAELDGAVVGYVYATSHFAGRLVHLVRIAVDPACQGRQVGVRLLAEVVAFADAHFAQSLTLNTQAYNSHAQRLYRWFGFRATGERQPILRCDI